MTLLVLLMSYATPSWANPHYDPSKKINQLALTMALVKQNYINPIDDDSIAEKAIKGLLSELDPHSAYLDVNDYSMLQDSTAGQVTGIGVEVTIDNGLIKVIAPLDNSPAKRAGIRNGDFITHINGTLVVDIGFTEAISRIKGKSGTQVELTIVTPGNSAPRTVTVTRELIKAPSTESAMLTPSIGYLKISYFGTPTASEAKSAVRQLLKKNPKISGLVIDLRNNPGGILESAVEITDLFLDKNKIGYGRTITTAKERNNKVMQNFRSETTDITNSLPLAVVINSGSASGSEIMAAALKDHKRAVIVGEPSFGKGSIQTLMPLSDDTAIKITTGFYYSPAGHVVQKNGVQPDVTAPEMVLAKSSPLEIREDDYLNAIPDYKKPSNQTSSSLESDIVKKYGFEVYQAINTLQSQQRKLQCS